MEAERTGPRRGSAALNPGGRGFEPLALPAVRRTSQRSSELIERDAFLLGWYGGLPLPAIDLDSVRSPGLRAMMGPRSRASLRQPGGPQAAFGGARVTGWPASSATEDFPLLTGAGRHPHGRPGIRGAYWMPGSVGPTQWAAAPAPGPPRSSAASPTTTPPATSPASASPWTPARPPWSRPRSPNWTRRPWLHRARPATPASPENPVAVTRTVRGEPR
ncbi:hypothetical protein E5082_24305 [Streptomyces griseoluteus]|uniref:YcaO domain-containing protein n=1 Tax=Streptomyces griseoluteus TaxID=29306 RepID=A0A4Z1D9H6_STRGP|nr:hypothetical protein E5082_24305 [Streptomyces griseoluteus]